MSVQSRSYIPARPTTYKGIQMRSRLEARFAAMLDRSGFAWEYEPRVYANERCQWLPDFVIHHHARDVFVEVKPVTVTVEVIEQVRVVFDSEPDAAASVFWPDKEDGWNSCLVWPEGEIVFFKRGQVIGA